MLRDLIWLETHVQQPLIFEMLAMIYFVNGYEI